MAKKINKSDISEADVFGAIRKSAEETIKIIDKLSQSLNKTAQEVKTSIGGAKFDSSKAIDNFVKNAGKANKLQKEAIDLEIKRAKAVEQRNKAMSAQQKKLQEQEKTVQARIKSEETMARQKNRLNKEAERAARLAANESNEYKKLEKRTRELKNQSKEYAATLLRLEKEGKKNTAEYRKLSRTYRDVTKEAQAGDKALKNIDSTVGDNFRNVGNYTGAVKGLIGTLGKLAGGFGVFQLIRGAGNIVKDFDQAQGDLQAISGKTEAQLASLTQQAKDLGATTQFSATQITEMQIELAKLGFTNKQIEDSTAAVANFAAATGAAIPDAAALAGSAMRSFGLEANEMERVVSTLGVATTKSALDFGKLQTGLSTIAPVANAFGFSIEDTTALLGQLANAGFDASSSATATRNILLNLADANGALAKELGRPITSAEDLAGALQELDERGIDLGKALELTDKRSVAAFKTFLDGSDSLVDLKDSITGANDELEAMAEKRLDTIGGQFTLLGSAWEGLILSINQGTGAGDVIKSLIGSLAANLPQVVGLVFKLAGVFLIYKTRLIALSVAQKVFADNSGKMSLSLKTLFTNMKNGTGAFKNLAKSMGSIGWTAAISGAVMLTKMLYDLASGALTAQKAQDALNAAQIRGAQIAVVITKQLNRQLQEQLALIDQAIEKGEISAEEGARQKKRETQLHQITLKEKANELKAEEKLLKAKARKAKLEFEAYQQNLLLGLPQTVAQVAEFKRLEQAYIDLQAQAGQMGKQADELNETAADLNSEIISLDTNIISVGNSSKTTAGKVKQLNTEFKNQIDLLGSYNDLMAERRQLEEDISQIEQQGAIADLDKQIQEEIALQKKSASETGEIDVDNVEQLITKKSELRKNAVKQEMEFEVQELHIALAEKQEARRKALEEEHQELIKAAGNDTKAVEEIEANHRAELAKLGVTEKLELENAVLEEKKIRLEANKEIVDIEQDKADEINDVNDELIEDQEAYAERMAQKSIDAAKKAADEEKKMWQDRMDIAQVATDFLTQMIDKRIAKLDEEIAKQQENQDRLRALAENGNIDAKESLAEAQRLEDEATRKKMEEEKRKQRIEFANMVFQTYGQKVQEGSQSPLADTFKDVALLQQFIGSFTPTFFDGTEDTGTHGQGIDGRGGFAAVLHPNERVMTKAQNKRLGDISNEELTSIAESYHNGQLIGSGAVQIGNPWESQIIVDKLTDLQKTIENQPVQNMGVDEVLRDGFNWFSRTQKGGNTIYNRYRVKK